MDGSCLCDEGWSFVDCSQPVPREFIAKSDFTEGPEGWTVYNNSCSGELIESDIMDVFDPFAINSESVMRGRCDLAFSGGDSGLLWEGVSGYLHLTDKLTGDGPSELAYLRAPEKFTGDLLSQGAYGASITYSLFSITGMSSAGAPHTLAHQTSAHDIILIGGLPRYKREIPVWGTQEQIYAWSRDNFPELRLNTQSSRSVLIAIVEQYLDTPQVFLGYKINATGGYPPGSCSALKCGLNFKFDLNETGWINLEPILTGFRWSNDVPVSYTDGTTFSARTDGLPYDPFSSTNSTTYDQMQTVASDTASRSDGGTVLSQSSGRQIARDENNRTILRDYDVYPEVRDAIVANRRSRINQSATFSDMAWCLASMKELLIRADFYAQEVVDSSVNVVGESMRFDEFSIGRYTAADAEEREIALFNYYRKYKDDYNVSYLEDLYDRLRPRVCEGKWYLTGEPDAQLGDACKQDPQKLRADCENAGLLDKIDITLGDFCVVRCPGYNASASTTCSGHGTCSLNDIDIPECKCDDGYIADPTGCISASN